MRANLDQFQREAVAYLEERGFVAFKGQARHREIAADCTFWDANAHPDYREFIMAAEAVGAKLVVVSGLEFDSEVLDEALEQLDSAALDRDARRSIEGRLKELRGYAGFVCEVELAFSHAGRAYAFVQTTPWYTE